VFYAYGISADLISDCSGAGLIRVASLSNIEKIESYESLQAEDLASKLDVRYTAEGTLWKMGDMFQLSVELYDTKDKKVVWSDRWQEKWDNLTTIKSSLSDGLLKALDRTSKVEKKAETTNTKAYELYLKAKHTHAKRTDINDTEKARKLLRQAIELDDTLIAAKLALGISYNETGDNDEAMEIFASALEQAEKLGDKKGMAITLNSIGIMNAIRGEYDTALECYERSLKIKEELGDKAGMAAPLGNIGNLHFYRGEYDTALEYHDRSLKVEQEIGDKSSMGQTLMNIGYVNNYKGEYDTALEYYDRSLKIQEEIGRMHSVALSLCNIGIVHANRYEHDKAVESLEKSLAIQKEIGLKEIELLTTIYLYLSYKHLGKDYDEQDIHSLIKDAEYYDEINFRLYQLLDDTSYLKKAYTQVQEIASEMEEDLGKTFLSYPIPKAIIEEWGKINN
jgi:tetratricopeptide (TPR) repeat protein